MFFNTKGSWTIFIVVSVLLFQSKTSLTNGQKVKKNCIEVERVASAVEKVEKVAEKPLAGKRDKQNQS